MKLKIEYAKTVDRVAKLEKNLLDSMEGFEKRNSKALERAASGVKLWRQGLHP